MTKAKIDSDTFLSYLIEKKMKEPIISESQDGEINFYWKNEKITLDLGFYGDGTYSFYAKFSDGTEFLEDTANISKPLPKRIEEELKQ